MNIRSVINAIEDFAPRALQESYDNAGLQAGDATNICTGVLLTLDVNENTVTEAKEYGLNCIISHHPLLFKGIKSISPDTPTGRILIDAISNGITIYSAHTNLDNARFGVSNRMAQMLGLSGIRTLQPQSATLVKLAVCVPEAHADKVRDAMADAGAGAIGDYDRCSYSLEGTGRFRAATGANPFVGEIGEIHQEAETKIEVIAPRRLSGRIIRAMLDAHPYEEPAYDIIPLDNADNYSGSGAVGNIKPTTMGRFIDLLKATFNCKAIRYCGDERKTITRVALCGGSGAFLTSDAIASGADIYVTGDVKYHDFTSFADKIAIADIGHYESEQCSKSIFREILEKKFPGLTIKDAETDINTIKYI